MDPAIAIEGCRNPGSLSPLTPVPSGCESLSTSLPALLGGNVGCRVGVSCIKEIFHGLRERAGPPPSSFLTSSHSVLEICIVRFPGLAHTLAPSFHRWAPHCARQSPKPRECRDGRNLALLSKSSQLLGWARRRAVRRQGGGFHCEMTVSLCVHLTCTQSPVEMPTEVHCFSFPY